MRARFDHRLEFLFAITAFDGGDNGDALERIIVNDHWVLRRARTSARGVEKLNRWPF